MIVEHIHTKLLYRLLLSYVDRVFMKPYVTMLELETGVIFGVDNEAVKKNYRVVVEDPHAEIPTKKKDWEHLNEEHE